MSDLSTLDLAKYNSDGFVCVRNAIDDNLVGRMVEAWTSLWNSIDLERAPPYVHWRDNEYVERIADRIDPVQHLSPVFREVCDTPSLRLSAEQLLGGPVFVMKDKLITKNPGTAGYGAHQDMPYWESAGLAPDDVLSVTIALDEITPDHGPIELFSGWHRTRLSTDESRLDLAPTALEKIGSGYLATMTPGDALYFHSLTPHRSATNKANSSRRIYMITYARDHGNKDEAIRKYRDDLSRVHKTHLKQTN